MENEPVIDANLLVELFKNGYSYIIYVRGRGLCGVARMVFTTALCYGLDDTGYEGRYCYETISEAMLDLFTWDGTGDPDGDWIKHKGKGGEYSNPNYKKE